MDESTAGQLGSSSQWTPTKLLAEFVLTPLFLVTAQARLTNDNSNRHRTTVLMCSCALTPRPSCPLALTGQRMSSGKAAALCRAQWLHVVALRGGPDPLVGQLGGHHPWGVSSHR